MLLKQYSSASTAMDTNIFLSSCALASVIAFFAFVPKSTPGCWAMKKLQLRGGRGLTARAEHRVMHTIHA